MFFSVKDLEVRKRPFDVVLKPGEIDFSDADVRQTTPLEAEGVAELLPNTNDEIRVRGRLRVGMEGACDRCLDPVPHRIDEAFDLFYRPAKFDAAPDETEIDEGESEMGFYEGAGLALSDVLREHILLSMPMQQVCGESCRGICPVCGRNRNEAACECQVKPADDRWAALRDLTTAGSLKLGSK